MSSTAMSDIGGADDSEFPWLTTASNASNFKENNTYNVTTNENNFTTSERTNNNYYLYSNADNQTYNDSSSIIMDVIVATTDVVNTVNDTDKATEILQFWIGIALSVSSSLFIGLSFIIKKKALIKLSKDGKRANQGGYGYIKDFTWWSGLLSMAVGEAANFMAYTFAPAAVVSTLGVLSVLVTAILSSKYLNERLNFLGKIGCFLCAIGSTVIVIHAPMQKDVESLEDLESKLTNVIFVTYVVFTIVLSVILIYHYRPKLPETSSYTLLIWIGVCSMIGSLSVMSVKGIGLALMQTIAGSDNKFTDWLTWFCIVTLIICISVQMNFLNKALDTFNTAVVTPIYYVMFTSCVIAASAILFNEFASLPVKDWIGIACGFFTVIIAIALLHLCKNLDSFTLANLTQQIDLVNSYSYSHIGGDHLGYKPLRNDSLSPLPIPTSFCDPDLKQQNYNDSKDCEVDIENDDIFKSVDSCNSLTCGNNKSRRASEDLTPDVSLLPSPYSSATVAVMYRDGCISSNYGTINKQK